MAERSEQRRGAPEAKDKVSTAAKAEFEKLKNKGFLSTTDIVELRRKFADSDIYDELLKMSSDRRRHIERKAKKFAKAIIAHYQTGQRPVHEIYEKAMKYKVKHGLSDLEFEEFRKILQQEVYGPTSAGIEGEAYEVPSHRSRIAKVFGSSIPTDDGLRVKENELGVLQEILKLHASSKKTHENAFMQSLLYDDMGIEAISGEYKRDRHSASDHVHPVIAALFLPKIPIVDEKTKSTPTPTKKILNTQ